MYTDIVLRTCTWACKQTKKQRIREKKNKLNRPINQATNQPFPCSRVFLEQLTLLHTAKNFVAFHANRRFFVSFTTLEHFCLCWARLVRSTLAYPTFHIHFNLLLTTKPNSCNCHLAFKFFLSKANTHCSFPPSVLQVPSNSSLILILSS